MPRWRSTHVPSAVSHTFLPVAKSALYEEEQATHCDNEQQRAQNTEGDHDFSCKPRELQAHQFRRVLQSAYCSINFASCLADARQAVRYVATVACKIAVVQALAGAIGCWRARRGLLGTVAAHTARSASCGPRACLVHAAIVPRSVPPVPRKPRNSRRPHQASRSPPDIYMSCPHQLDTALVLPHQHRTSCSLRKLHCLVCS